MAAQVARPTRGLLPLSAGQVLVIAPILTCILFMLVSNKHLQNLQLTLSVELPQQTHTAQKGSEAHDARREAIKDDIFAWSNEHQIWTLKTGSHLSFSAEESSQVIWPEDCSSGACDDRIVNQLRLRNIYTGNGTTNKLFKILPSDYSHPIGQSVFQNGCSVNKCQITYNETEADALIFQNSDVFHEPPKNRRADQVWIAYMLESPLNTFDKRFKRAHRGRHEFNWTASYHSDSDIVTPYSKFLPYQHKVDEYIRLKSISMRNGVIISHRIIQNSLKSLPSEQHKKIIRGKSFKVAWFASNCNAANSRLEYARELAKFIQVDIYGKCGNFTCSKQNQTKCVEMINNNYKFYLSFENSNCREYITEKLYRNAYGYNDLNHLVVPIVMGAPRADYERFTPPGSFIHVDDFANTKDLANYLRELDLNDALYDSYFHWKTLGRFIDTKFMCRVCAMLHETSFSGKTRSYLNMEDWWTCDR